MTRFLAASLIATGLCTGGIAAGPHVPADAPYCAPAGSRAVFVAPMGEPFRAERGAAYPSALWFNRADANHDGMVDRAEFTADAATFFRTVDRDGDGRIVPDEVIAYERDVAPEISLYGPHVRDVIVRATKVRNGESGYGNPLGAGRYAWLNVPEPVSSADVDFDRVITRDEFAQAGRRRFDVLAPGGRLMATALPRTPMQVALEGPCRPRPKPRRDGPGRERRDPLQTDGTTRTEGEPR